MNSADSMNTFTPKKKRGRPPKPTSLSSKITTTLNIAVNTPTHSSPAETNSNQIVKQGQPDFFTPLMKVSPTTRYKPKKRKSMSATSSSQSSPAKRSKSQPNISFNIPQNVLITPTNNDIRLHNTMLNSKALDNICYITNTPGTQNGLNSYMMTPSEHPTPRDNLLPPVDIEDEKKFTTHQSYNNWGQQTSQPHLPFSLPNSMGVNGHSNEIIVRNLDQNSRQNSSNTIPTISTACTSRSSVCSTFEKGRCTEESVGSKKSSVSSSDFSLKLMVDDSGKAVLSGNFLDMPTSNPNESPKSKQSTDMVKKEANLTLPKQLKLTHANTVIGIESFGQNSPSSQFQLSETGAGSASSPNLRINHDSFALQAISENGMHSGLPQTPNLSKDFMFSTGLTPSSGLLLNLTPQFNSMMCSMMGFQSPNFKKQWNEDLANSSTISMSELVSTSKRKEDLDDSGDAKLALKKMINVKESINK
jgi:hypothetical protein